MKKIVSSLFLLSMVAYSHAQQVMPPSRSVVAMPAYSNFVGPTYANSYNNLLGNAASGEDDIKFNGSPYLYEDWREGVVEFKDKMFKFDKIKYDVLSNELEINVDDQVKVLDHRHCDKFLISDGLTGDLIEFTAGKEYKLDGAPLIGYFETYYKSDVSILLKPSATLTKADYNKVTMTGSKLDKVSVSNEIYFEKERELTKIRNKKDIEKFYGSQGKEASKYIKSQKLDVKSPDDLILLVNHFDKMP